jgi:hypothetical protein
MYGVWWGNLRERDHWGDPGVDGRVILRWIFRKWDVGVCTGSWCSQLTHARNIHVPNAACLAPPEDEQVMLETCKRPLILNKLNEKCITLVSLY